MITLTEKAAQAVVNLQRERGDTEKPLRIFVVSGGCSGMEYGMGFETPAETDIKMESAGIAFYVEPKSLQKIDGSVVDFDDGLMGKGFEIKNPQAKSTCGCGKSFA